MLMWHYHGTLENNCGSRMWTTAMLFFIWSTMKLLLYAYNSHFAWNGRCLWSEDVHMSKSNDIVIIKTWMLVGVTPTLPSDCRLVDITCRWWWTWSRSTPIDDSLFFCSKWSGCICHSSIVAASNNRCITVRNSSGWWLRHLCDGDEINVDYRCTSLLLLGCPVLMMSDWRRSWACG